MQYTVLVGDVREKIKSIQTESIDCIVTSPPYWSKRKYEAGPNEIGQEKTSEEYIDVLTMIFKECYRVLKIKSNFFLNIDDTFGKNCRAGMKKGSMLLIPEKLLSNLYDMGFYVRGKYIWRKMVGKPESIKDRLAKTYEHIFHLTKSTDYYFDLDSVKEEYAETTIKRIEQFIKNKEERMLSSRKYWDKNYSNILLQQSKKYQEKIKQGHIDGWLSDHKWWADDLRGNPGDILALPTSNYPEAHFAVFNLELPLYFISMGCPKNKDAMVFDPFLGTGTTLEAAGVWGVNGIGVELSKEYISLIRKRLLPYTSQRGLFESKELIVRE